MGHPFAQRVTRFRRSAPCSAQGHRGGCHCLMAKAATGCHSLHLNPPPPVRIPALLRPPSRRHTSDIRLRPHAAARCFLSTRARRTPLCDASLKCDRHRIRSYLYLSIPRGCPEFPLGSARTSRKDQRKEIKFMYAVARGRKYCLLHAPWLWPHCLHNSLGCPRQTRKESALLLEVDFYMQCKQN